MGGVVAVQHGPTGNDALPPYISDLMTCLGSVGQLIPSPHASSARQLIPHTWLDQVCRRLQQIIAILACKHKATKFVQSVGSNCIPNYPDRNLPTVFIYHEGELVTQFVGPRIFGGEGMGVKDVEWALAQQKALTTDLEEDPKGAGAKPVSPIGVTLSASARKVMEQDRKSRKNSDSDDSDDD